MTSDTVMAFAATAELEKVKTKGLYIHQEVKWMLLKKSVAGSGLLLLSLYRAFL